MVVSFDEMPDDDYNELYGRIQKLKMEELFEEPSKYEDENEDDNWRLYKKTGCSRKVITLRLGRSEGGALPPTPIASFMIGTLDTKN